MDLVSCKVLPAQGGQIQRRMALTFQPKTPHQTAQDRDAVGAGAAQIGQGVEFVLQHFSRTLCQGFAPNLSCQTGFGLPGPHRRGRHAAHTNRGGRDPAFF